MHLEETVVSGIRQRKIHQPNPHFLQPRLNSSFLQRLRFQKRLKKDKVDPLLVGPYLRFKEAHRWWPFQGHARGQIFLASLTMTRIKFIPAKKFCRKTFLNHQHHKNLNDQVWKPQYSERKVWKKPKKKFRSWKNWKIFLRHLQDTNIGVAFFMILMEMIWILIFIQDQTQHGINRILPALILISLR